MHAETVGTISFGLLLLLTMLNGVRLQSCNYYQEMEPGQSYYIYNSKYPEFYQGINHCTWQLKNPYIIKVNCSIDMPASMNCDQDSVSIQFEGGYRNKYCGKGIVVLEGINATIRLDTAEGTSGGKFLCQVQSESHVKFDEYNCKCGWTNPTRIVGGEETGINEFPMMAGLVDTSQRLVYCGATIISDQCVLTAAHCIERKNINKIGVLVGEHDVNTGNETNATKLFRVSKCDKHPLYQDEKDKNDVAVCKIVGRIEYSSKVGPVCLPFQHHQDSFIGDIVTVLGWGLQQFGGDKASKLQKVDLNVISPVTCRKTYPYVNDDNLCTYTPGKDSCQMDSGGPVLWKDPTTYNQVLIGITSSGIGCGSDEPAVDMRVGRYIDWIVSVTPDVQYCKVE